MSFIAKGVKKVTKGIGKVVKKVVKGIVNVGKKIVKGIGKVMGKLGPIGTIALGFIAPYALGFLASGSFGAVSTIAKGIQAVSSAVAAPFKIVGQAIGKGISAIGGGIGNAVGGALGEGIMSITDKISGFLGYQGGSITDGAKSIMDSVGQQWDDAFGTSFSKAAPSAPIDAANVGALDTSTIDARVTEAGGLTPGSEQYNMLAQQDAAFLEVGTGGLSEATQQALMQSPGYQQSALLAEQNLGFDPQEAVSTTYEATVPNAVEAPSLLDKAKDAFGSLAQPAIGGAYTPTQYNTSGYDIPAIQSAGSDQTGGTGQSFYAQDKTGLMRTEDLAQQMFSLLSRNRGYA